MLLRDMLFALQRATGVVDEIDTVSFESLLLLSFTSIKKISVVVFFNSSLEKYFFYHHSKTLL